MVLDHRTNNSLQKMGLNMNHSKEINQNIKTLTTALEQQMSLEKNGDGAVVFLNGPWGCGKTFFWKNRIKKKANESLYVSLFGVSKLSELREKIVSAIVTGSNESGVIYFFRNLFSHFSLKKPLEKWVGIHFKCDILDLIEKRYVICFDDLERLSKEAQIDEILGFINHLAEHRKYRCLVIINEDEIKSENHKIQFNILKEKLSLRTFALPFNLQERTNESLELRAKMNHLNLNEKEVADFVGIVEKFKIENLRVINFAIDCYLQVRKIIEVNLPIEATKFLIALVANESLSGPKEWEFYNLNSLEISLRKYNRDNKKEVEQAKDDPQANYYHKYFGESQAYTAYSSIYEVIKTGLADQEKLKKELFPKEANLTPAQHLAGKIKDTHFFFSTDQDLEKLIVDINSFKNKPIDDFSTFYIFMVGYSSAMTLLERDDELSFPLEFKPVAEQILMNEINIDKIISSLSYTREDISKVITSSLLALAKSELIRRKREQIEVTTNDGLTKDFKNELLETPDVLESIFSDGLYEKIFNSQKIEPEERYRILTVVNKAANQNSHNPKISEEINKISKFLNTKYSAENMKMERLRLYRLIEVTGRNLPDIPPKVVRKN
jgi:hypothetical protein